MTPDVQICFSSVDLEDCKRAVAELANAIIRYHGPTAVQRLFSEVGPSRRDIHKGNNLRLMAKYIASGVSVKRCAAMLAKENKSLARNARYGPSGTTSAETMEKQIRRQKEQMTKDALYRERVERLIEEYRKDPHHRDEMFKRAHQKKTFRE